MAEIIHTNMYSDKCFNYMSAITERLRGMRRSSRKLYSVKVERAPNGEVIFNTHCSKFSLMTENDAKIWFARSMKAYLIPYYINVENWKRDNYNTMHINNHDITICDFYLLYDILINRKNLEIKYPDGYVNEFRGHEKDALATELEVERRNQIKQINDKYQRLIYEADPNCYGTKYNEISKLLRDYRTKLYEEANIELNKIKEQQKAEIDEVEKMCAFATTAPDVASFPFS